MPSSKRSGERVAEWGTHDTDGLTDAAEAIVNGGTIPLAIQYGMDAASYLENNDSYYFFARLDALERERHHLVTGPTRTNVMDLQIIMVEA